MNHVQVTRSNTRLIQWRASHKHDERPRLRTIIRHQALVAAMFRSDHLRGQHKIHLELFITAPASTATNDVDRELNRGNHREKEVCRSKIFFVDVFTKLAFLWYIEDHVNLINRGMPEPGTAIGHSMFKSIRHRPESCREYKICTFWNLSVSI